MRIDPGHAVGHDGGMTLAGRNSRRRLQHGRDARRVHGTPSRAVAHPIDQRRSFAACGHAVYVGWSQPGVCYGTSAGGDCDRVGVVVFQHTSLLSVVDADNSDIVQKVFRHHQIP